MTMTTDLNEVSVEAFPGAYLTYENWWKKCFDTQGEYSEDCLDVVSK